MTLNHRVWSVWTLFLLAPILNSQQPVLKDANGDSLPEGAIGRLGQQAFRVTAPVKAVSYLDDGRIFLVRTDDRDYRVDACFQLFDAQSGKELNRIISRRSMDVLKDMPKMSGPDWHWYSPEWRLSPNSKWLARVEPVVGKNSTKVQWQEVATGKVVAAIEATACSFHDAKFSPNSKYIAAIVAQEPLGRKSQNDSPTLIRMWEVATQKEARTFALTPQETETFTPRHFAFSPNGAFVAASGRSDGAKAVVRVWESAGDKPSWALDGQPVNFECGTPFAFSPDSKSLAAIHDGKLGVWDAATGKQIKELADYQGRCALMAFSPTGKRLLTCKPYDINGRAPAQIQMWDTSDGSRFDFHVDHPTGFAFSRDSGTLVVGDETKILVCNGVTGAVRHTIDIEKTRDYRLEEEIGWPFALSPDGDTLIYADRPGQVRRISVATGKSLGAPNGETEVAEALAFSLDGKKLLAAGKSQFLLHEVDGSKPPLPLSLNSADKLKGRDFDHTPRVHVGNRLWPNANCVAMSKDASLAAAGLPNGMVSVWSTSTGALLWQARASDVPIHCLAFAPDDLTLIGSSLGGQIIWFDAATGRVRRRLDRVPGKAFDHWEALPYRMSHNGQTAFGMSPDSEALEEWELSSGKVRRSLDVLPYPVDFTRDGRSMLVIGENAYHSVDLISGRPLRSFEWEKYPQPETNPYGWCRFSPDGGVVAGIVHNNILRFWDADTASPLASMTDRAGFTTLAFAPDGKMVATASANGTILLWRAPPRPERGKATPPTSIPSTDAAIAKEVDAATLPLSARARFGRLAFQQGDDVYALRYSPDGNVIIAATASPIGSWNRKLGISVWASETGKLLYGTHSLHVERLLDALDGDFSSEEWRVSPSGKFLAAVNLESRKDGERARAPLVVQELSTGKILFKSELREIPRFSPDGKSVALVGKNVKLYDLVAAVERMVPINDNRFDANNAHFTPDGQLLVIVGTAANFLEIRWCRLNGEARGPRFAATPPREDRWAICKYSYPYDRILAQLQTASFSLGTGARPDSALDHR